MTSSKGESRIQISSNAGGRGLVASLAEDVRKGLTKNPKELPPKYFYDAQGVKLFEQICELPEYYLTRTERTLLEKIADEIVRACRPTTLIEFGPGNASKTRILLDAMARSDLLDCYVPIDVSEELIRQIAVQLGNDYTGLSIHGVIGDFERPIKLPPARGRRLIVFLGSTIGNLTPAGAVAFLRNVAGLLTPNDRFLLGTDLVKDINTIERAYNDTVGVTAAFNRNILSVINQNLGADFDLDRFEHLAFYNTEEARIEMHLVAREAHRVRIEALNLSVDFAQGESVRTEISCKYTRVMVDRMLHEAGLRLLRWETDDEHLFALSLSEAIP